MLCHKLQDFPPPWNPLLAPSALIIQQSLGWPKTPVWVCSYKPKIPFLLTLSPSRLSPFFLLLCRIVSSPPVESNKREQHSSCFHINSCLDSFLPAADVLHLQPHLKMPLYRVDQTSTDFSETLARHSCNLPQHAQKFLD